MSVNLDTLSYDELVKLENQVAELRAQKLREEEEEAKRQIREIAKKHNLTVTFGAAAKKNVDAAPKTTVAPKYRSQQDASLTWTGRGRKPNWVASHLDAGGKLEDLAI